MLHDVGLTRLSDLGDRFPTVAAKLEDGQWCKAAEQELLRAAGAGGPVTVAGAPAPGPEGGLS